ETLKDLFSKPVLPEMTDVHLPLNLNIEEFRGEQLRVTGDTDLTVHSMLHLLGYDHEDGGIEQVKMREKEEKVMTQLGLSRGESYTLL
ncbi:MAG: rRNA maturation RNAse YbeY, partial [Clostridia bacterium]